MADQGQGPDVAGPSAADFITNPDKAIGDLRAQIRQEIIGTNIICGVILYMLLSHQRGGGPSLF